ncbi:creatininase family protein [Roseofilum sp. SID3]|uniref:creatininase family protein n=1 Tax=unclassified Roseofilum TaxID=2620099 RepID=UPI000E7D9727|nr:creatininase family protein [Roseofilum sp. Belize Diploria]MBP0012486.1 creatininase family protein [Roseofilum sp. SID3]MBP0024743.1 creatininase family protein [Roseofilum sp. SID2]MBP0031634.1 creatininase family protein [Roseofilum sp. Belize BBD 4]MBP0037605.1 creatininase family protein [Roseofilum sp. SID1]MBP0041837.1 creatininase family protein [Roseofilum sp. SBFL]HBQ97607.1 creatinine amidohydrolase [Cyanobacteria bacterium UBA11691]
MHSFIPPHRFFPYLTWTEIRDMPNKENVVIVQPIGAIEQHGPHLPLIVDSAIATGVLGKALEKLPEDIPVYALPTQYYGKSNEHINFPGTITLSAQTLLAVLKELGESIYRAGFRKLVFLNAHGGQPEIISIIARDLHIQYADLMVFPLFVWRVPNASGELLKSQPHPELSIHADLGETSLLLSLLPDRVHMERAVKEYPQGLPPEDSLLSMEGKLPFAWATHELSQSGVFGDPTGATSEIGDRLLDSLAQSWAKVLQDVYDFSRPNLVPRSH